MLLPRRGGHLRPGARWAFGAWVLVVLALHGWVWSGWRDGLWGAFSDAAPIERLRVHLRQVKPLQTPELGPRQLVSKRLAPPPAVGRSTPETLEGWERLPPSTPMDAVQSQAPNVVPSTGAGEGEPGPEWPLSTRLVYQVVGHYQGPVHGDAEVEWLRQGARYQVRLKLSVGPKLTPFASRELVSEGEITPNGIVPQRYVEDTRLLLGPARRAALRREGDTLWLADGRAVNAPPGLQDSASQFVHLAWVLLTGRVPLELEQVVELPLALPRGVYPWRYQLANRQFLESVVGHVEVWHLRPLGAPVAGALMAEVWLMPEMDFLPLQILITQNEDTWVRLTLAEPPMQETPSQNSTSQSKEPAP